MFITVSLTKCWAGAVSKKRSSYSSRVSWNLANRRRPPTRQHREVRVGPTRVPSPGAVSGVVSRGGPGVRLRGDVNLRSLWGEVRSQVNGPPWRGDPLVSTQSPLGLTSESLGCFLGKARLPGRPCKWLSVPGLLCLFTLPLTRGSPDPRPLRLPLGLLLAPLGLGQRSLLLWCQGFEGAEGQGAYDR